MKFLHRHPILLLAAAGLSVTATPALGREEAITPVSPSIIASVPRSGSVDTPLMVSTGYRQLRALTMTAAPGRVFAAKAKGRFNGRTVRYEAKLSEVILSQDGAPIGSIFSTSYVALGKYDPAKRPVIFMFNGGPGSSSAPLQFAGAWGPKRYKTDEEIKASPGEELVDNDRSPLDQVDLVFFDPIDTGFSRSSPGHRNAFRSVDTDSEAASRFVATWLRENGRLQSPVYILGESYGTMRAAAMARDLARLDPKIVVSGIIMAGAAPTFGQNGRVPNPLLVASKAPMMASIAYHYGKIDNKGQTWEQAVQKARDFARMEWLPALYAGHAISQEEFDRVAARMPDVIGIPAAYFHERKGLEVDFTKTLLAKEGLVIDRRNGLLTSVAGAPPVPDRAFEKVGTRLEDFFATFLAADGLGEYWTSTPPAADAADWNFMTTGAPALDVTLSTFLREYPSSRYLLVQGRHDTLTDLGSNELRLQQTDVPRERSYYSFYDGGHLYANTPESNDYLRKFVADGVR